MQQPEKIISSQHTILWGETVPRVVFVSHENKNTGAGKFSEKRARTSTMSKQ